MGRRYQQSIKMMLIYDNHFFPALKFRWSKIINSAYNIIMYTKIGPRLSSTPNEYVPYYFSEVEKSSHQTWTQNFPIFSHFSTK